MTRTLEQHGTLTGPGLDRIQAELEAGIDALLPPMTVGVVAGAIWRVVRDAGPFAHVHLGRLLGERLEADDVAGLVGSDAVLTDEQSDTLSRTTGLTYGQWGFVGEVHSRMPELTDTTTPFPFWQLKGGPGRVLVRASHPDEIPDRWLRDRLGEGVWLPDMEAE